MHRGSPYPDFTIGRRHIKARRGPFPCHGVTVARSGHPTHISLLCIPGTSQQLIPRQRPTVRNTPYTRPLLQWKTRGKPDVRRGCTQNAVFVLCADQIATRAHRFRFAQCQLTKISTLPRPGGLRSNGLMHSVTPVVHTLRRILHSLTTQQHRETTSSRRSNLRSQLLAVDA